MKYRILKLAGDWYEVQEKCWWWPFWSREGYYRTFAEANDSINRQKFKPIVVAVIE